MSTDKGFRKISAEELHKKRVAGEKVVLVDTLPHDYFNNAHIPGAKNACVFEVVFLEKIKKIIPEMDREVVLYGSSEKSLDAVTAAEKLVRAGYKNVNALEGGLKNWFDQGYEVEGDNPELSEIKDVALALQDHTYLVDTEQSVLEWTGRNPNTTHFGTVQLSEGRIIVKNGQTTGFFEIDMTSIRNINLEGDPLQPVLVGHLLSDDFFFTKLFPRAVFALTSATPIVGATQSEPNFEVNGTLELRGIKKELSFASNVSQEPGGEVKIETHFDMDRTQWGVIYGSTRFFEKLGMHLVFDHISIQLHLLVR